MFDQLTDTEAAQVESIMYRGSVRLYDAASEVYARLMSMSPSAAGYAPLLGEGTALMRAAREQNELHQEVRGMNQDRVLAAAGRALGAAV